MNISKITYLTLILFFSILSCNKDQGYIPFAQVDLTLSLDDPQYSALRHPGGYIIIYDQGAAGLIIYKTPENNTFRAYDLWSPVNNGKKCTLIPHSSGKIVTVPCSRAVFSLRDGSSIWETYKHISLKRYTTYLDPFGRVRVTN